jgi:hypothetical protein
MRLPKNCILPTPEQCARNHYIIEDTERAGVRRVRNTTQLRIDRYYRRGLIDDREHQAGNLLYDLYAASQGSLCRSSRLDAWIGVVVQGGPMLTESEYRLRCREEYDHALRMVGRSHASVLADVVIKETAPDAWADQAGYANTQGVLIAVRQALRELADVFERGRSRKAV